MNLTTRPAHYQTWFTAQDFRARHAKIYDHIGSNSVAVLQGAGPLAGFELFRQTNEFFYLTGLDVPQAYLLLDGRSRRSTLYLPPLDAKLAASEGTELSVADVKLLIELTGCDRIEGLEQLGRDLAGASWIFTPHAPAEGNMACQDTLRFMLKLAAQDPWENQTTREMFFIKQLRERFPSVKIDDLSPQLVRMRLLKEPAEIAVMRRSGQLTALAVNEAIRATQPGVYEYQLGAITEYVYRVNGCRGASYRPIIATGENIWFLHYYRNTSPLKAGDWVLMDVAPDVANYSNDIGRFWPVNGKYSDLQRLLYGFVVKLHQCYLKRLGPGILLADLEKVVAEEMAPVLNSMKFQTAAQEKGVRAYFAKPTAITHTVGMAVHDNGSYKDRAFEPGLVFALDPQIWIPEEKIYVRVEDTVVITDNGVENLTSQSPLELDAVEAMMKAGPGMLQMFPATPVAG